MQARIRAITDLLLHHPRMGALTTDPTIQCITTSPYPYLVFYEVADAEVIINARASWRAQPLGHAGRGIALARHSTNGWLPIRS